MLPVGGGVRLWDIATPLPSGHILNSFPTAPRTPYDFSLSFCLSFSLCFRVLLSSSVSPCICSPPRFARGYMYPHSPPNAHNARSRRCSNSDGLLDVIAARSMFQLGCCVSSKSSTFGGIHKVAQTDSVRFTFDRPSPKSQAFVQVCTRACFHAQSSHRTSCFLLHVFMLPALAFDVHATAHLSCF